MPGDPDEPRFDVPVGLFEDVEDLKAQLAALTAQVQTLTAAGGPDPGQAAAGDTVAQKTDGEDQDDDEEAWKYPPFILLLDSPGVRRRTARPDRVGRGRPRPRLPGRAQRRRPLVPTLVRAPRRRSPPPCLLAGLAGTHRPRHLRLHRPQHMAPRPPGPLHPRTTQPQRTLHRLHQGRAPDRSPPPRHRPQRLESVGRMTGGRRLGEEFGRAHHRCRPAVRNVGARSGRTWHLRC